MRYLLLVGLLVVAAGLLSCTGQSGPAPAVTPPPVVAQPEPVKTGWEAEWQKTLAEAKKEGKIIVYGPPGGDIRRALTEGFHKAYPDIDVEYFGASGAMIAPKGKAEKRTCLNTIDFHIGGTK